MLSVTRLLGLLPDALVLIQQVASSFLIEVGNGEKFIFDMGTGSYINLIATGVPAAKLNKVCFPLCPSFGCVDQNCEFSSKGCQLRGQLAIFLDDASFLLIYMNLHGIATIRRANCTQVSFSTLSSSVVHCWEAYGVV